MDGHESTMPQDVIRTQWVISHVLLACRRSADHQTEYVMKPAARTELVVDYEPLHVRFVPHETSRLWVKKMCVHECDSESPMSCQYNPCSNVYLLFFFFLTKDCGTVPDR